MLTKARHPEHDHRARAGTRRPFPDLPVSNPEIREAMQKGLELCADKVKPDILIGTDPDCDRCGAAVPDQRRLSPDFRQRDGCHPAGLYLPQPHRDAAYAAKPGCGHDNCLDRLWSTPWRALWRGAARV